jgi:Glutamate decarboxylase and related PLP-dependent proteins
VAFRLSPAQNVIFDEWALAGKLRERGWIVPAYTMAADCTEMGMMRAVVRTDFSMGRCVSLVRDVQDALGDLAGVEIRNIQRYQA